LIEHRHGRCLRLVGIGQSWRTVVPKRQQIAQPLANSRCHSRPHIGTGKISSALPGTSSLTSKTADRLKREIRDLTTQLGAEKIKGFVLATWPICRSRDSGTSAILLGAIPVSTRIVEQLAYGKDLKGGAVPGIAQVPGSIPRRINVHIGGIGASAAPPTRMGPALRPASIAPGMYSNSGRRRLKVAEGSNSDARF
jgi:hypothetical protein